MFLPRFASDSGRCRSERHRLPPECQMTIAATRVGSLIPKEEEDQEVIPRQPPSNYRKELKVFIL